MNVVAGIGVGLMATAGAAYAQTIPVDTANVPANASENTYGPEFYARYSPRSALDMVQQTPGFTITESVEKRGLGVRVSYARGNAMRSVQVDEILFEKKLYLYISLFLLYI